MKNCMAESAVIVRKGDADGVNKRSYRIHKKKIF